MTDPLFYARERRRLMLEGVPPDLSPHLRHTLEALLSWAGYDDVAWVRRSALARQMRVGEPAVKLRLRDLRDQGVLGATLTRWSPQWGREHGYPILRPQEPVQAVSDPSG